MKSVWLVVVYLQETGTLDDSDITTDVIRLEDGTDSQLVPFEFILEDGNLIQEEITHRFFYKSFYSYITKCKHR